METSCMPLFHRLLSVLGHIVLDSLFLHERGQNCLIDWVVYSNA